MWGPSGKCHLLQVFWYLKADIVTLKFYFSGLKSHNTSNISPLCFCDPTIESFCSFLDVLHFFLIPLQMWRPTMQAKSRGRTPHWHFYSLISELSPFDLHSDMLLTHSICCPSWSLGAFILPMSSLVMDFLVAVGFLCFGYSLICLQPVKRHPCFCGLLSSKTT